MSPRIVSAVRTRGVAVVTPHHLASRAAMALMHAGGNAVDAAVGANAVLGTVLPTTCGTGGDLLALVHKPGMDVPDALNASGRGGSGLDAVDLRVAGHKTIPIREPSAVTIPGCVDGWVALLGTHGTLGLSEVLGPAIQLAEEGFEVSAESAAALADIESLIGGQPSAPELFPLGRPPSTGERMRRPRYATVLRRIAAEGRDAFYQGPVADAIIAATRGVIGSEDLVGNRPDWVTPIGIRVFDRRGWTFPPNSQGYLTLASCWLFSELDPPTDPYDAGFLHAAIEAYRAMAWERDDLVADDAHAPLPPGELLDTTRLAPRLEKIRADHVAEWPASSATLGGTSFLCVVDAAGMGVSLIQSNYSGIGSGISAGDFGVWLHNRGAGFSLLPGHPNEAAPGKRPLHTLAPTLWTTDGGDLSLLLGTQGGHQQPQYLSQMAALLLHAGLEPADAQRFPRWHIGGDDPADPSHVSVEAGLPDAVATALTARGHHLEEVATWQPYWGPVSTIAIDADGTRRGAADPRVSTATAVG